MTRATVRYSRILVKLSGEALMGDGDYGIEPAVIRRIAGELQEIREMDVQLALVIGGGNIFRRAGLARAGMDRVAGDHMRSGERRVGEEGRSPWTPDPL